MDHQQFTKLALRTESVIASPVVADQADLESALGAFTEIGAMLDAMKKRIFYNREIDRAKWAMNARAAGFYADFMLDLPPDTDRVSIDVDSRVLHGIIGIITEAVELAEALALALEGKGLGVVNIAEEIGGIEWYKAILLDAIGISEASIREKVISKLRVRYPEKYTDEGAINRDLVAERKSLEG